MARSQSTRILPIFAAVAVMTLGVVLTVWLLGKKLSDANASLLQAQHTQLSLADVLVSLTGAETGVRGYVLTGDTKYLEPWEETNRRLPGNLDELDQQASTGDLDPDDAHLIRHLAEERLARLGETLTVYQASGRDAAIAEIRTDLGRLAMEEVHRVIERAEAAQAERIVNLSQLSSHATAIRTLSTIVGALVVLAFLVWAYRRLARDVRERERIEADLEQGRQRLEGIVASAMDAIISADERQNIVLFNAAAEKVFGYSAAEVVGTPLGRLIPPRYRRVHEDHVRRFGETGQTTRAMGTQHMNLSAIRADGTEFPIDASISQVKVGDQKIFTAILRDVTERKRAEEELLSLHADLERRVRERTSELAAANRELEAFGYSVSHDLRAPLRHVTGFVELLEKHAGPNLDEKGIRYVKTIHDASRRMGNLIDDLLTLSRIGRATLTQVDVNLRELVDETISQLSGETAGRHVEWKIGDLPVVNGDPTLLRNVVMNLLTNALKYTRGRDPAIIEINSRKEGDEVICFFKDNGVGFDMQFVDKLFGVFQRLHRPEEFEGTGIGLASVRRIIQKHGGRTWAEGAVDKGATVYFALPVRGNQT